MTELKRNNFGSFHVKKFASGRKRKSGPKRSNNNNNHTESDGGRVVAGWNRIPGGFSSVRMASVFQPDVMEIRLRYETTSAFTSTGGAASFVQLKGNSIYHPYVGNTDNPAGYARMYADYQIAEVLASRVTVRLWGGVSGQDEPFRICLGPCDSGQYSVYSGFTNIAQLWDAPHFKQVLFSPGGVLPSLTTSATTAQILLGQSKETGAEFKAGGTGAYAAATGADPTNPWYYLIGYQNMAGTTTTNQQAQVSIEYDVRFIRPVAVPVQVTRNKFGNEESPSPPKVIAPSTLEAKVKLLATSSVEEPSSAESPLDEVEEGFVKVLRTALAKKTVSGFKSGLSLQ